MKTNIPKKHLSTSMKGLFIGATMLVPGVSGGTMAMILGIYDKLISSVSSVFKDMKRNLIFLCLFSISALLGMMIFSKPLLSVIEAYTKPMMYLFIGAVIGGIPDIYKKSEAKGFSYKIPIYTIIGVAIMVFITSFSSGGSNDDAGIVILLFTGFLLAISLVLPGISVSYMLLIMGIYEETMIAIGNLHFGFLLPIGIGLILGILLTTKVLDIAMKNFPMACYLIIFGFVIASVAEVFPGIPHGFEWVICGCTGFLGFSLIRYMSIKFS